MIELSNSIVKTRKTHQCFGCLLKYPKGTKMDRSAYVDDGRAYSVYLCIPCLRILEKYRMYIVDYTDNTVPEGVVNDAMRHFTVRTPEELLFKTKIQGNGLEEYFSRNLVPF